MSDKHAKIAGPAQGAGRVPQADPGLKYRRLRPEIDRAVARVLASGTFILGPETEAFENEFASFLQIPHVIGVGSGTDAITLALHAVGVTAGDEVLVPAMTASATAMAVRRIGAVPRLVDVESDTRAIDPDLIERAAGPRTTAVVVVHLHGLPARMNEIISIARKRSLAVVEDCAHAHGAHLDGRKVGSFGDAAAFSFYPTKNLGCAGDGGAVATRSADIAARVRRSRQYGWDRNRVCMEDGFNSRLDEIQAAMLRVFLPHLNEDNAKRQMLARFYDAELAPLAKRHALKVQFHADGHVYHQYALEIEHRDRVRAALARRGIGTAIHYSPGLHRHPLFRDNGGGESAERGFPVTDRLANSLLSLPIQPELEPHRFKVISGLSEVLASGD
ncbi:MAG: DegT/DnrJ/EryC1/StrS family aminotransferase [Pseudorhodoplanes sp.]